MAAHQNHLVVVVVQGGGLREFEDTLMPRPQSQGF